MVELGCRKNRAPPSAVCSRVEVNDVQEGFNCNISGFFQLLGADEIRNASQYSFKRIGALKCVFYFYIFRFFQML